MLENKLKLSKLHLYNCNIFVILFFYFINLLGYLPIILKNNVHYIVFNIFYIYIYIYIYFCMCVNTMNYILYTVYSLYIVYSLYYSLFYNIEYIYSY